MHYNEHKFLWLTERWMRGWIGVDMENELIKMSLEELWELFPIFLVEHNERWKLDYEEIEGLLRRRLSVYPITRISHIGSTAIDGIWAKNIVDVLVEIPVTSDMGKVAQTIEQSGFIRMFAEGKRISFNRGYTKEGFADQVYHVHLRYFGDNDELYFRDYLNGHPQVAREYEKLKLELWKKYEHNRDAYTESKTDFICKWTLEAHREYGDRY